MPNFFMLQSVSLAGLLLSPVAQGFTKAPNAVYQQNNAIRRHKQVFSVQSTIDQDILESPLFVDEEKLLEQRSPSSKSPEEMIAIAKKFLVSRNGLGADPDLLSSHFQFEGPVVGPLSKSEFINAIGRVDFAKSFPDFQYQFYGFHVDPFDGDRVWFTARGTGQNSGPFPPFVTEERGTGITVVNPPQVSSITIDHATGLVRRYTIGYVVDRNVGNTGGLGGLYGILYAIGKPLPFPEANPWKKSFQYDLFQKVGGLLQKLGNS